MSEDSQAERERVRAAAALDYEIDYLVVKTGLSRTQASDLVSRYGIDREVLMKHARTLARRH